MTYIIKNAKIATMNEAQPLAAAAVVDGEYFAYAGSEEGASEWFASRGKTPDKILDLNGRFMLPGFNDSHMHYLHYVKAKFGASLYGSASLKEVLDRMTAFFKDRYDKDSGLWVSGEGWNQDYFEDVKRFPTSRDLDAITTDYPMIVMRACFHIGVLNSRAMEAIGLNRDTAASYGAYVETDENGEPNGVIKEKLFDDVKGMMPAPDIRQLADKMEETQVEFFAAGITSVQTDDLLYIPTGSEYDMLRLLRDDSEKGLLRIRYAHQVLLPQPADCVRFYDEEGLDDTFGNRSYKISCVKLLADGSLGARTAYMRRPYADDAGTQGIPIYTQEALNYQVLEAHRHNMAAIIHAIGDGAIEMCLNAIENARRTYPHLRPRHGIVHCQITTPEQLRRFRELDVSAFVQPVFIDYDMHIVRDRVGDELTETSYAWRTYIESGVHTSFGTDCPVENYNPMRGLYCAVTQKSINGDGPFLPQQIISRQQALYCYTAAGAYETHDEDVKGLIAPGYLADYTVLDTDLLECPDEAILKAKPVMTAVGGEIVFC